MRTVLNGLTRGLDLSIIDDGFGEQAGCPVSFYPTTNCLGLVMPSNSPAVNSLWLPADRAQDAGHHQARPRGTVDAVPPHPGLHRRGRSRRGIRLLSDRPRRLRRDPEALRPRADLRRRQHRRAIQGQPEVRVPRPRLQQDPHRRGLTSSTGASSSISSSPPSPTTAAAPASTPPPSSCRNTAAEIADALAQKLGPVAARSPRDDPKTRASPASPIRRWPSSSTARSKTASRIPAPRT